MKKIVSSDIFLKAIIIILSFTLILIIFQFINTYKKYSKKEGNVYLAFYNGDQQLTEMPQKGNTQGLGFEHAECNNGASVAWNYQNWAPIVRNMTKNKTKCNLYFAPNLANDYFGRLSDKDTTNLTYDETEENNLRYIGASPYNYIDIGDRDSAEKPILWRIIGVMNNMTVINDDKTEIIGQSLVKIIRSSSIGSYSWDSSASGVNSGYGVNEWSKADLMKLLNPEDIYTKDSEIGNSLYWNKTSGQCYNTRNDGKRTCDFSSTGLTASVKDKLVKVRWNTGTIGEAISSDIYSSDEKFNAKALYTAERSTHNGKELCASSGGNNCNDPVERTTTWDGFIGLMYPSDYGYAVGGNVRVSCLAKTMSKWDESSPDCTGNDWLYDSSNYQWTITPVPDSSGASRVFYVSSSGSVNGGSYAYSGWGVRPVAYLKSNIKIKANSASDYGNQSNPFVLEGVN